MGARRQGRGALAPLENVKLLDSRQLQHFGSHRDSERGGEGREGKVGLAPPLAKISAAPTADRDCKMQQCSTCNESSE